MKRQELPAINAIAWMRRVKHTGAQHGVVLPRSLPI
jgi:hypothetical protein